MPNPVSFRYFKTSPEIIQLAVMLYVRFPLSLRNVEDLVHERCVDVSYESVRYWWHRFGSQFARQIKKRSAGGMQSSNWRWRNGQRRDVLACLSDTTPNRLKVRQVDLFEATLFDCTASSVELSHIAIVPSARARSKIEWTWLLARIAIIPRNKKGALIS